MTEMVRAFEDDEFPLSEIATYVNFIAVDLEKQGLTKDQIQQLVDGYESVIVNELLPEGIPDQKAAVALITLYNEHFPMYKQPRSLLGLSYYVANIVGLLLIFCMTPDDALDVIDEFEDVVNSWYRVVPPRTAARRLAGVRRRLEAGRGAQENLAS